MRPKSLVEDELLQTSSDDSRSEDDEDGRMLTEDVEKEFYKTLSRIKNKDPKIYNKEIEFFKDIKPLEKKNGNEKKSTPLTLQDFERKLLLEKGGDLSDEEPLQSRHKKAEFHRLSGPTYVEEQESLKKSLKEFLNDASEDEDDKSWGGLFKKREKTVEEKDTEDKDYKDWLKGKKESVSDEEIKKEMKPLRCYWTNPNLNQEDQFLRDYILNKKFLDHDDTNEDTVKGSLLESNEEVTTQEKHDHNYKHRFEEPDQEFIKRYPRVMENSVRRKNDQRKQKRDEIKERKRKDKEKKRAEIKHKKKLMKMEIKEKIEELKKLTGEDKLALENVLNQDFDLNEHDKAMQQLFSEEFYSQEDPNFHPSDSAGLNYEAEAWGEEEGYEEGTEDIEDNLNCEDPNFNMDCDYDPNQEKQKPKESRSRRRKDKHRRTTVSEVVNKEKPKFDPAVHESFKKYLDEYYAIDCEDFIGDLPCRYKYREVVPNSFGLTIEEILAADDKELDRWCSIKRIQQRRLPAKEKCDVKVYQKRAQNEELKRKILPSLYKNNRDQEESENKKIENTTISSKDLTGKDSNKKEETEKETTGTSEKHTEVVITKPKSKHKKKKNNKNVEGFTKVTVDIDVPNKNNKKRKTIDTAIDIPNKNNKKRKTDDTAIDVPNKHNKKRKIDDTAIGNNGFKKMRLNENTKQGKQLVKSSKKHNNNRKPPQESNLSGMSDARLLAYGIKPKKFRNKLKYGKNT